MGSRPTHERSWSFRPGQGGVRPRRGRLYEQHGRHAEDLHGDANVLGCPQLQLVANSPDYFKQRYVMFPCCQ